jgi:hypothetical protein
MRPVPFPHPQPPPLILTPKDEAILQQFAEYHFLTSQEITALCYSKGSHTYARARCSRLAGNKDLADADLTYEYPLYRWGFPTGRLGNQERIFAISLTGRQILEHLGIPVSFHFRPSRLRTYAHSSLLHDLARNRFVVALHAWAKKKPNLTVKSQLSYELAKSPAIVEISLTGKMVKVSVIPDAILLVTNTRTNQRLLIILEIDQNTQAQGRFKQHIAARLAYVKSPHFTITYGDIPYRIVYVTQGMTASAATARLQTMVKHTMNVLTERNRERDSQYFRFTTINFATLYEDACRLFEQSLWHKADDPKLNNPVSLLTG